MKFGGETALFGSGLERVPLIVGRRALGSREGDHDGIRGDVVESDCVGWYVVFFTAVKYTVDD